MRSIAHICCALQGNAHITVVEILDIYICCAVLSDYSFFHCHCSSVAHTQRPTQINNRQRTFPNVGCYCMFLCLLYSKWHRVPVKTSDIYALDVLMFLRKNLVILGDYSARCFIHHGRCTAVILYEILCYETCIVLGPWLSLPCSIFRRIIMIPIIATPCAGIWMWSVIVHININNNICSIELKWDGK